MLTVLIVLIQIALFVMVEIGVKNSISATTYVDRLRCIKKVMVAHIIQLALCAYVITYTNIDWVAVTYYLIALYAAVKLVHTVICHSQASKHIN